MNRPMRRDDARPWKMRLVRCVASGEATHCLTVRDFAPTFALSCTCTHVRHVCVWETCACISKANLCYTRRVVFQNIEFSDQVLYLNT